jgi:hypothetical protein
MASVVGYPSVAVVHVELIRRMDRAVGATARAILRLVEARRIVLGFSINYVDQPI